MFVRFILAIVLAVVFFKLGVLTVLVTVLKALLEALLFVVGGFGLHAAWRQARNQRHWIPARLPPRWPGIG